MDRPLPIRQPSLVNQVVRILVDQINGGVYPAGSRIPPENQLAADFQVSRSTIRSAFDALEARGLVVRRQGIGTFVTRVPTIPNPLNQFIDFNELISANGFQPGYEQLKADIRAPSRKEAKRLRLTPGETVLEIHKVFTADGERIIYCINLIPTWILEGRLTHEQALQPGVTEPFFEFFEAHCGKRIEYFTSRIRAEVAKTCPFLREAMSLGPNVPVLVIDEVGYCEDDRPVHNSVEYHPGNRMEFGLVRHRGPV